MKVTFVLISAIFCILLLQIQESECRRRGRKSRQLEGLKNKVGAFVADLKRKTMMALASLADKKAALGKKINDFKEALAKKIEDFKRKFLPPTTPPDASTMDCPPPTKEPEPEETTQAAPPPEMFSQEFERKKKIRGRTRGTRSIHGATVTEQQIMSFLKFAQELDEEHCLPRAICEVIARGKSESNSQTEKLLIEYYGLVPRSNMFSGNADDPMYIFNYGAYVGQYHRSTTSCAETFSSCLDSSEDLRDLLSDTVDNVVC